ncbi:MAG: molybdenum cofactor guanylyltransferase [Oscillochloridaceae bacterium umkhey_bin13]
MSCALSAIVLAGGQSRRFGQDKRFLRLAGANGPTLLEQTLNRVRGLCAEIVVVLNDPEQWSHLNATLVPDVYPTGGALGGIYSGLQALSADYALVVGCDMPLLNPAVLRLMAEQPRSYDILVPRSDHPTTTRNQLAAEPLHAIYGKPCLGPMQQALEAGQRRIIDIFSTLRVTYLDPEQYRHLDPHGHTFLNVNTREQIAIAQAALGLQ